MLAGVHVAVMRAALWAWAWKRDLDRVEGGESEDLHRVRVHGVPLGDSVDIGQRGRRGALVHGGASGKKMSIVTQNGPAFFERTRVASWPGVVTCRARP